MALAPSITQTAFPGFELGSPIPLPTLITVSLSGVKGNVITKWKAL